MKDISVLILFGLAAFLIWVFYIYKSKQSLEEDNARLRANIKCCETIGNLEYKIEKLKREEAERRQIIDDLIKEPEKTYGGIAKAYADYIAVQERKIAEALYFKYGTYKSRQTVIEISDEKKKITEELKNLQYRYEQLTHGNKIKEYIESKKEEASRIIAEYSKEIKIKEIEAKKTIAEYNKQILQAQNTKELLYQDITKAFSYLASILSNIQEEYTLKLGNYLQIKANPALKTAAEIKTDLKREISAWSKRAIAAETKLAYYEATVPVLEELSEGPVMQAPAAECEIKDETKNWLTQEEYNRLSSAERNQRALDNYKNSHNKSKRQIGRDYERYVGWLYETKGYKVEYKGILDGLEDLGRDLICRKDGRTLIIQCKYWSKDKLIHEKHINQLFGTYMHFMIEQYGTSGQKTVFDVFDLARDSGCAACFWTKTSVSDTARAFADALKIEIHENEGIEDYPMIKCNINRTSGEKIYHLPFDINYDKTIIDPASGEFYATTVKEAEAAGFRRTYKWTGN